MARSIVAVLSASLLVLGLSGCNTVRGLGDDLKSVADTTEEAI